MSTRCSRVRSFRQFVAAVNLSLAAAVVPVLRADDRASAPLQVTIERAPFRIRDAASYDIPLKLQAVRQVTLVALVDGVVQPYRVKPGEKLASQTELLRLDGRARQLEIERAAAALQAAQQEVEKGGPAARVAVAKADLALAELRMEQTLTRMPWDGAVLDIHVVDGQFVRAGDPLVTVADQTKVVVDVPIDRTTSKVGDRIEVKVEDLTVQGELTVIRPLSARLDPLRSLFQSIASGLVVIDNADGRFLPGQTVYSALIPRHPVGDAPAAAILNADDGQRKVQVIRDGIVRDVPVQLLGQMGEQHVWISGRFAADDQLILSTSEPLPDGTLVTLKSVVDVQGLPQGRPGTPPPARPRAYDQDL